MMPDDRALGLALKNARLADDIRARLLVVERERDDAQAERCWLESHASRGSSVIGRERADTMAGLIKRTLTAIGAP